MLEADQYAEREAEPRNLRRSAKAQDARLLPENTASRK